jgi:hypothetical protein
MFCVIASYIALHVFITGESFVHNAIPLSLAALLAVAIIVIGCVYVISPERMTGSFVLSRLHPMLTLVPGYALKEFGTSYLDWSC